MTDAPLLLLALLALHVAVSEWLVRNTPLAHLGTALLVIVLTAISANVGLVPTYSDDVAVYRGIFEYVAPLAIFLLLLQVRLREVLSSGRALLVLFLIGCAGTFVGALAGMGVVDGAGAFGERYPALAGMFVGTYTGGSVNYNAIALHYGVVKDGTLYAGAAAVDSLMTTIWMAVTLLAPGVLRRFGRSSGAGRGRAKGGKAEAAATDEDTVGPIEIGWLLFLAAGSLAASEWLSREGAERFGWEVPSILILTTVALVLAQIRPIQKLRGGNALGMFSVYLFLAVIGALCDVNALGEIGRIGVALSVFATVLVVVHGTILFGASLWLRADPDVAAVASQAAIGGGTSALALARSLGRNDLTVPAILVGSLGNALGTYLGFLTARLLG